MVNSFTREATQFPSVLDSNDLFGVIEHSDLKMGERLGIGEFGTVHRALWTNSWGEKVLCMYCFFVVITMNYVFLWHQCIKIILFFMLSIHTNYKGRFALTVFELTACHGVAWRGATAMCKRNRTSAEIPHASQDRA